MKGLNQKHYFFMVKSKNSFVEPEIDSDYINELLDQN